MRSIVVASIAAALIPGAVLAGFGVKKGQGGPVVTGSITHPTQVCIDVNGGTDELCVTDGEVTITALQEQTIGGIPIQRTDGVQVGFIGEQSAGGLEVQSSTTMLTLGRSGQTAMLTCNGSACTLQNPLSIQNASGLQVGAAGTFIPVIREYSAVIDVPSIAAQTCVNSVIDPADTADAEDPCFANFPTNNTGLIRQCHYDGIQILLESCNNTAAAIDPASTTYSCTCFED